MTNITIGILAHVDAGKTTLSDNILYKTGCIRTLGRVDHKTSFLDYDYLEKERGITIYSKEARFVINGQQYTIIDTPGHMDFTSEMEKALDVIDYAILIINASEGLQSQTVKISKYIQSLNIPTVIFINKMDLYPISKSELLDELNKEFNSNCIDFSVSNDELYESLSTVNDKFLNKAINNAKILDMDISEAINRLEIIPCFFGSALKDSGVNELINCISKYFVPRDYSSDFSAKIYKVTFDDKGTKLCHLKVTGGILKVKDEIEGENSTIEKVEQIYLNVGNKFTTVSEVCSGDICSVVGLKSHKIGDTLGKEIKNDIVYSQPVLEYKIITDDTSIDLFTLFTKIKFLQEENPNFNITWIENKNEIRIQLMGEIQKEIIKQKIYDLCKIQIAFESVSIIYKETIEDAVVGLGHFEPLRHYAEVHLLLEPGAPGTGITFSSKCSISELAKNWQNLIFTHIQERQHKGVLVGAQLTDIKITILNGRAHPKHTEGGDFRQATYRAIRNGLMQAKSVLLEPFYKCLISIPTENVGRIFTDVELKFGQILSQESIDNMTNIICEIPVSTFNNYLNDIYSYSKGKSKFIIEGVNYKKCHNQEEVVKQYSYNPLSDIKNTPDSVFCSNGTSNIIPWNEVKNFVHIDPNYLNDKKDVFSTNYSFTIVKNKKMTYNDKVSEDKLLDDIFEKTYGPIKKRSIPEKVEREVKTKTYKSKPTIKKPNCLLVDGYNIIYAWSFLNEVSSINFELARKQLIDILSNYQAYNKITLILVFDAYKVPGGHRSIEKHGDMYIVYTKEKETADAYIEKTTYQLSDKFNIKVATSDYQEQIIVLGNGALRMSANELLDSVKNTEKEINDIINQ